MNPTATPSRHRPATRTPNLLKDIIKKRFRTYFGKPRSEEGPNRKRETVAITKAICMTYFLAITVQSRPTNGDDTA